MLTFFTIISFLYLVLWAAIAPRVFGAVKTFDPTKGRKEGDKVVYPLNSREGRYIQSLFWFTFTLFGALGTFAFCLVIWFFKLVF